MEESDVRQMIQNTLKSYEYKPTPKKRPGKKPPRKKRMEFSKKIMVFASVIFAATWIVSAISWFWMQLLPGELFGYSTGLYTVALAVYGGKSAYENKPKIEAAYGAAYSDE